MDDIKQLQQVRRKELNHRQELLELARRRAELMTRLWDNGNGMTYQSIADIYGVKSRERVRAIIERHKKAE